LAGGCVKNQEELKKMFSQLKFDKEIKMAFLVLKSIATTNFLMFNQVCRIGICFPEAFLFDT
jgi:hypothetical protein